LPLREISVGQGRINDPQLRIESARARLITGLACFATSIFDWMFRDETRKYWRGMQIH